MEPCTVRKTNLDYLISKSQPAVLGGETQGVDVVQEDLGVSLLVLVLIAEGQAQQLAGVTGRPLQFNFLKIFQFNIMEIFCCFGF